VAKSKTIVYVRDDETAFLNVDVGVYSASPLDALATALGRRVSLHYVGPGRRGSFQLHFALYSPRNADSAVRRLVKLVESLGRSPRRLWNEAQKREFDMGFQGGLKPYCIQFDLSDESVAAITRVRRRQNHHLRRARSRINVNKRPAADAPAVIGLHRHPRKAPRTALAHEHPRSRNSASRMD
jgi:hypothetical protein